MKEGGLRHRDKEELWTGHVIGGWESGNATDTQTAQASVPKIWVSPRCRLVVLSNMSIASSTCRKQRLEERAEIREGRQLF